MVDKITACCLCSCNCGLVVSLDDAGKVVKIRGDRENPLSRGFLCNKGRTQGSAVDSPHRLTQPLKRVGGRLVEVSWEEALDGVAEGLLAVRRKHGARAISLAAGGSPHPVISFVFAYSFLRLLGSRNMYSPVSLEFTSKYLANQKMFGCSYVEGHPDFENARFSLLIGTNPFVSHPISTAAARESAKDPSRTTVVVDPRLTETGRAADLHLPIRPSTDIYFLLALIQVITSEGLYDREFAARRTRGLEALARAAAPFTPEAAAKVTGLDAEKIREVAWRYATEGPSLIFYDMGVVANRHSTLVSWAVKCLTLITGNIGRKGTLLFNPTLLNQNKTERLVYAGRKYVSRVRGYPEITGHLPITVLQDEILTPGPGQVRAAVVDSCNPLRGYSNAAKMERAFGELELLVSIDPFLTEVGRQAHYVLPACSFYEEDNVSCGFVELYPKRFVQLTRRIRPPLGGSRPRWTIYGDLMRRLGRRVPAMGPAALGLALADRLQRLRTGEERFDLPKGVFSLLARQGGTNWKALEANPHGLFLGGGEPLDILGEIRLPGGKARLDPPEFLEAVSKLSLDPPAKDPEYPLLLSTTCRTPANLNTLYRDEGWIEKKCPENRLLVHAEDARALHLADGDRAVLATRTGRAETAVSLTEDVLPGTVYLSHGFGLYSRDPKDDSGRVRGAAAATFVPDEEADAFTGMPFLSGLPCRLERVKGARKA